MIQFDCHAHVYENLRAILGARYVPRSIAPRSAWLRHLEDHGLQGGVIIQVSFLGTDNTELCKALSTLGRDRFAGVAVTNLDVSDHELDVLLADGVKGLRWNLVGGSPLPDLEAARTREHINKLRARNMHLEVHLEGPRLAPVLPALTDLGLRIVIDHFGLPSEPVPRSDPMIRSVASLSDRSSLFFKFSGHYRTPFDLKAHSEELISLLPKDQIVWGSDNPHTQHENQINYSATVQARKDWGGINDKVSAATLYGLRSVPDVDPG